MWSLRVIPLATENVSPMAVATAAKIASKSLILLNGGPGRTRTSSQAVMSALPQLEKAGTIPMSMLCERSHNTQITLPSWATRLDYRLISVGETL